MYSRDGPVYRRKIMLQNQLNTGKISHRKGKFLGLPNTVIALVFTVIMTLSAVACSDDDGDDNNKNTDPVCGDSVMEEWEQCDDGNTDDGDGCDSLCMVEITGNNGRCGDGNIDSGEECDDGNTDNGDNCSAACLIENTGICGDGTIDLYERCDDGNTTDGDDCPSDCACDPFSETEECPEGTFCFPVGRNPAMELIRGGCTPETAPAKCLKPAFRRMSVSMA